jgi:hypothetical protein
VFGAVQAYMFEPAMAAVLKKISPTEQVAGRTAPVFADLVVAAEEKSTLFDCVLKSI